MADVIASGASQTQERLRALLAEMVHIDQSDLDFGIYRIMGLRRTEFLSFLTNDLFPQVQTALKAHSGGEAETVKAELDKVESQVRAAGVDPNISPVVKELRDRLGALGTGVNSEAEDEIFSALFSFFRRYYDKGDFLALPRYKAGVYSIPYSGEEVKLHWANADQYYVKSSESFRDYAFTLPDGRSVHFRLTAADTETDNNKVTPDKDRVFKLAGDEPVAEEDGALVIRFRYEADPTKRKQPTLNAEASQVILAALRALDPGPLFAAPAGEDSAADDRVLSWSDALTAPRPTEKNKDRKLLDLKLADYTARNSFDYFIHKDLGKFLRRELDFFLKNEVLYVDDWDRVEPEDAIIRLRRLTVIRQIAQKIIAFLAQTENLQKRLWLKKKFVVGGGWCVTLDRVPAALYPQVEDNEAQRVEWVRLFAIDKIAGDTVTPSYSEPLTGEFLAANPFLVLDTKFFDTAFTDTLLGSAELLNGADGLDTATDGVIVNGDNFQALNLLGSRYAGQIKCIYIDPPYNTDSAPILYKNDYRHSSWASLMWDRLLLSKPLLQDTGSMCVAIDDTEMAILSLILENIYPEYRLTRITVVHNPKGSITKDFNRVHEYALFLTNEADKNAIGRILEENKKPRRMRRWGENSLRVERRPSFYPITIDDSKIIRIGQVPPDDFHPSGRNVILSSGEVEIWPIDQDGVERRWNFGLDTINLNLERICVLNDEGILDLFITHELTVPKTVWTGGELDAGNYGNTLLTNILGKKKFDFPKSINLVKKCLYQIVSEMKDSLVMDFFGGSGTTGHAVINLNREDNGQRQYILVEMGQYFDTVLKPRLQKVIYSKDWKDGEPVSRQGSSHLMRYLTLESYEDALNNLTLHQTPEQAKAIAEAPAPAREEYLLRYMLHAEAKDSLLSAKDFADPFGYSMKIATDSAGDARETPVDLVETFHWLLGMRVQKREVRDGVRLSWGLLPDDRKVLVLWRRVTDLDADALDAFFQRHGLGEGENTPAIIYVNGDNTLRRRRPEGQTWRVELIEPEFLRRMFGETDPFVIAEGA